MVSGILKIGEAGTDDATKGLDERNKVVIFKNCALFIGCIGRINNIQVNRVKDLDVVMPIQ